MSSKTWKKYYDRPPFVEGCASAFDLFGENTSFNFDMLNTSLPPTFRARLKISSAFSKVGKYLRRSMECYDQK